MMFDIPSLDSSTCDQCINVCCNMSYESQLNIFESIYASSYEQVNKNFLYEKVGGI